MRPHLILAVVLMVLAGPISCSEARSERRPSSAHSVFAPSPIATKPIITTEKSDLDRAADLAQIGATTVSILALVFLGLQIMSERGDTRAGWTLTYQSTYNDRSFRTIASRCTGFFDASDAADCVRKIRAIQSATWADEPSLPRTPPSVGEARASGNDLRYVLGFFETLGNAYNDKKLDRKMVDADFASPAVWFFVDAWWYICWRRASQPRVYDQFANFAIKVRSADPELEQHAKPKRKLRFICLPKRGANDAHWAAAERVSKALSARANEGLGPPQSLLDTVKGAVEDIEGRRAPTAPRPTPCIETLITVPSDIDIIEDHWRPYRARALELKRAICQLDVSELDKLTAQI